MARAKLPATPALRALEQAGVAYLPRPYQYQEHGGTSVAAALLGLEEHRVIKTLVMEDEARRPLLVLMHGDREVSTKSLARSLGAKSVSPCDPARVERLTGYQVGGVSPFGTRTALPVYVEASILDLARIAINGGRRGLLVELDPQELVRLLKATLVSVGR
jgi:Cys-tRNA(Pro) deacylase